jgi:serine/threonine protein kinase
MSIEASTNKQTQTESLPPAVTPKDRVGTILAGRYRLDKFLAKGGMGMVYLATQLQLERTIAIKLLNGRLRVTDPGFARRFVLEASTSARLIHPNVVTVHDYGESESGDLFIAMEYLNGLSLSKVIEQQGPLPFHRILRIATQIGRAMRVAHHVGVIHRDLKPSNIMLVKGAEDDSDHVKVLDFGLAKVFENPNTIEKDIISSDLTHATTMLGSPKYMSPEQIRCEQCDPRTDIYSFGVVLFLMCSGAAPYTGDSAPDIAAQHLKSPMPSMSSVGYKRRVPPEIESIVTRCMSKTKEHRYPDMTPLLNDIKSALRALLAQGRRASSSGQHDDDDVSLSLSVAEMEAEELGSGDLPDPIPVTVPAPSATSVETSAHSPLVTEAASGIHVSSISSVSRSSSSPRGRSSSGTFASISLAPVPRDRMNSVTRTQPDAPVSPLAGPGLSGVFAPPTTGHRWLVPVAIAAVAAGLIGGGVIYNQLSTVQPPADLGPAEFRVTFESEPAGAEVLEQGTVIGVTPFMRLYPAADRDSQRQFAFRLKGHESTTLVTPIARDRLVVKAELEAEALVPAQAAVANPTDSDKHEAAPMPTPAPAPVRHRSRVSVARVAVAPPTPPPAPAPVLVQAAAPAPTPPPPAVAAPQPVEEKKSSHVQVLDEQKSAVPVLDEVRSAKVQTID